MGKETYAWLTGLFVVILGGALVAIAFFLGDYGIERDTFIVTTQGTVSGLNPESTVIYRGVPAGKVVGIHFDPKDVRNIFVRIEVDKGLPVTKGTYATLRIQGLTGLAQVELNDSGENPEVLPTSSHKPAHIPLRPSLVEQLTESGKDLLPQMTQLAVRLNSLVDDENRARIRQILSSLEVGIRELIAVEGRVDQTLAGVPALRKDANRALGEMTALSRDLKETSQHIRRLAKSTEEFVASSKRTGEALGNTTVPRINALVDEMQRTTADLRKLAKLFQQDPQMLLLGTEPPPPGPGEPGYQEPR